MSLFDKLLSALFPQVPTQPTTQAPTWYRDEAELERLTNRLRSNFRNLEKTRETRLRQV